MKGRNIVPLIKGIRVCFENQCFMFWKHCLGYSYVFLLSDPLLPLPPVWSTPTPSSCLIHSYPFLLSDPLLPLPPVWSTPTPLYHSLMLFICNKNNMSPSLVVLCLMVTNLYLSVFVVSFVNDNHVREFVNNV